jgi:predicted dienelactone hydrolase
MKRNDFILGQIMRNVHKLPVVILSSVLIMSCSVERQKPVGERRITYEDLTRKSWVDSTKHRPLVTTIWYPAKKGTIEYPTNVSIFQTGLSAHGAEISNDKSRYPLILLSHGTGGSSASVAWLGKALAEQGYIVAVVNHHGNTAAEKKILLQGFTIWWERPVDISAVIDLLLCDRYFGPKIDKSNIGVAGFSLGGYTALACIGARLEIEKWRDYAKNNPNDPISHLPPESPYSKKDLDSYLTTNADFLRSLHNANSSFLDKRIKAAYVIAPVLGPIVSNESLNSISVPVKIVVGGSDDQGIPSKNAIKFHNEIPNSKIIIIKDARHYTFLSQGNFLGRIIARDFVGDPKGVNRKEIQEFVSNDAIAFFQKELDR